jgi:hypothetical protein
MHDWRARALKRLEGAGDQLRPALHQDLQIDVVGHAALLDRPAREVEIGLRGGRKADLDFLETHIDQELEHARLAIVAHRVDQGLIAVAQIDGAPDRRLFDPFFGPGPVVQPDSRIRLVFSGRVRHAGRHGLDRGLFVHRLVSGVSTLRARTRKGARSSLSWCWLCEEQQARSGISTAGRSFSGPGDRR